MLTAHHTLAFLVLAVTWGAALVAGFVWIVGYDGDVSAANDAYYSSPERAAMDPDPARLVGEIRQVVLEAP